MAHDKTIIQFQRINNIRRTNTSSSGAVGCINTGIITFSDPHRHEELVARVVASAATANIIIVTTCGFTIDITITITTLTATKKKKIKEKLILKRE